MGHHTVFRIYAGTPGIKPPIGQHQTEVVLDHENPEEDIQFALVSSRDRVAK